MPDFLYYVHRAPDGRVTQRGCVDARHREMVLGMGGIEISAEDYAIASRLRLADLVVENGKIAPYQPTIQEARDKLMARIDAEAEQQRQRFLAPHPGQAQVHAMKLAEAKWFLDNGNEGFSDTPFLNEEGVVRGDDDAKGRFTTAQRIVDAARASRQGLVEIERERMRVKIALRAADTPDKLDRIANDSWAKWPSP